MISRVQILNEARTERGPAFRKFMQIHKKKSRCLFCFFEGEDVKYYRFRIQEHLPALELQSIDCGGKEIVLSIYQLLKRHENSSYQEAKKVFFVDRDFDDPLADEIRQEVYETPCYSIENFYTTLDCFKNILKDEFKIDEFSESGEEELFQQCLDFFQNTQQAFHEAMIDFNAWILVTTRNKIRLNLHDEFDKPEKFDQLVKIEVHRIERRYKLINLPEGNNLDIEEIRKASELFSNSDYRCKFRGKQELLFFTKFLTKLRDELCCSSPQHFKKKRKISFSVPTSNPLSALTQYAHTPECLRNYLATFK